MLHAGLVSITFRTMAPHEVIALAVEARLAAVEWGGDVHVPHGNIDAARKVRALTVKAGLEVAAYGSYYRVGQSEQQGVSFDQVLRTAVELNAPTIRVWAGALPSDNADAAYRKTVVRDARRIADMAAERDITISFEYHAKTLTDTNESALLLLDEIDHPMVRTYWQPPNGKNPEYCLEGLRRVLPVVTNIHVFQWTSGRSDQQELAAGTDAWLRYLRTVFAASGHHYALLEFVKNDSPEQLRRDAATLHAWLRAVRE